MKIIETNLLTKNYGTNRGIIDVNLSIEEKDFFGFIGPNGAGKSTTIRLLLGLINKTSGSAKIFGLDCEKDKIEILKNIGYIPSETSFYSGMKVKDIINLSAKLYNKNCDEEAKRICQLLDLDVNKKIDELSLGNKKKVSIVCALQHKPKLYILDEPTSGLDPLIKKHFFDLLKERNEEGATIFFSSHVLSEVEHYCKHASIIKDGKIITTDEIEKLTHNKTKNVSIKGLIDVSELNNCRNIIINDNTINFLYDGDINDLLNYLSKKHILDLSISEPDLEEVFMHYYGKGE